MAVNVNELEGKELADDYIRSAIPTGRWSDAWGVFKSNFGMLILINIFVLITFAPGILVVWSRAAYISGLDSVFPSNLSINYPFYADVQGLSENVRLSADLLFYSLLIVAGFVASLGISGAAYSIKKMLSTHKKFAIKDFFHGIKVCYFSTVMPLTLFMIFMFAALVIGDWKNVVGATGGDYSGALTAYVFIIIATVLVGIYCGWLFAVGISYKVKFKQLFKNAFMMMIGTPLQTIIMAGFTLIPVWLLLIGGIMNMIGMMLFIVFGFSFMILSWVAFTQWGFDLYVTPNLKAAAEQAKANKSEKELAEDKLEEDKRTARELLAAGKSELIARPVMPIAEKPALTSLGFTFTRGEISSVEKDRANLGAELTAYEDAHKNDEVYVEYNKLFAEREKVLKTEDKKGKKKKISADNLLK